MNWTDPRTGDFTEGFRERGFLPEAMINMMAVLGWNDGSGQELFSVDELIERFDLSRVSHSGAVFDYEKARWFNHQHIQRMDGARLLPLVKPYFEQAAIPTEDATLMSVIELVKERCHLLPDFVEQGSFFFKAPEGIDTASILPKWKPVHAAFFEMLAESWSSSANSIAPEVETSFNDLATAQGLKKGEVMLALRIMLVGGKWGPGVFDIIRIIGTKEAAQRVASGLTQLSQGL
jgi:glutamyl-tRNA synthetase